MKSLTTVALALVVALLLAASASAAPWSQYRNDPAGDGQSIEVGSRTGTFAPGFPINLPPRNAGLSYLQAGAVVVASNGIAVVADGFTVSAYSPAGQQLWSKNLSGTTQGLDFVSTPALSASGSTIYVVLVGQDPGGNADPGTLFALSTATGGTRWSTPVGVSNAEQWVSVDASNNVYLVTTTGNGGDVLLSSQVQAFTSAGTALWTTAVPGFGPSGVILDGNGNAYYAGAGTGQTSPSVTSIATAGGTVNWTTTIAPAAAQAGIGGPPVLSTADGALYVSTGINGAGVSAISLATGADLGQAATTPISGPLTFMSGLNLVGASASNTIVAQSPYGSTSPNWVRGGPPMVDTSGYGYPAAAIDANDNVFAATPGYVLSANGSGGSTNWIYRASGYTFGSPAIGPNGSVYVVMKASQTGKTQLLAFAPFVRG